MRRNFIIYLISLIATPISLIAQHKWEVHGKINLCLNFLDTGYNQYNSELITAEIKILNKTNSNIFITDIPTLNNEIFYPWSREDSVFFEIGNSKETEMTDFKTMEVIRIKCHSTVDFKIYIYSSFLNDERFKRVMQLNYVDNNTAITKTKPGWLIKTDKTKKRVPSRYIIEKSDYFKFCQSITFIF